MKGRRDIFIIWETGYFYYLGNGTLSSGGGGYMCILLSRKRGILSSEIQDTLLDIGHCKYDMLSSGIRVIYPLGSCYLGLDVNR